MILLDQIREQKLIELAKTRFDPPPTEAEEKVLRDSASSINPTLPKTDAPRPTIRPEFVRWLATDPDAVPYIDPKGLRVVGVTLSGDLDLMECCIGVPFHFHSCTLKGNINLVSAASKGIYLIDSSVEGAFIADRVEAHGPIFLRKTRFSGQVLLKGAQIKGDLDCEGAKLEVKEGDVLSADGAKIGGNVFLREGFTSSGEIKLIGAQIKGDLDCSSAKLKVKEGDALSADGAKIGGNVFLRAGFTSSGTIRLLGARIKIDLDCSGAKLEVNAKEGVKEVVALFADGAEIGGKVFLRDGFESSGTIRLVSARIGGQLAYYGAKVAEVNCYNLRLSGDLLWMGIRRLDMTSINLMGAKVKNLREDKESWPEVENLGLDGLVYEEVTLHRRPSDEEIKNYELTEELPLNVEERIAWLMLQPEERRTEPQPWMQLRDLLERKGDRKGAKYVVFKYRCLQAREKSMDARSWLSNIPYWIRRTSKTIYRFAKCIPKIRWKMRRMRAWLRVMKPMRPITFWWSNESPIRIPFSYWHMLFAWLEENPLRIGWSILFTLVLGTAVFTGAIRSGAMIETVQIQPNMIATYEESSKGMARKPDESIKPVSIHYTSFHPFIYTLENAVPLVKLGIDERWMPDLQHQPRPWFPKIGWLDGLKWLNSYGFLVWFRWLLIVWGWVQATIFAASVADRFRK